MKSNKFLLITVIVLSVIVLSLLGIMIYKKDNFNIGSYTINNNDKDEIERLEISDKNVVYIDNLLSIVNIFNENEDILRTLFNGDKEITIDDLSNEQKLFFAVRAYVKDNYSDREFASCVDYTDDFSEKLDYLEINKKDLEGYFTKDITYLDEITDKEVIDIGDFQATIRDDEVSVCNVIYGLVGPGIDGISIEPVAAYKEGNKVVVSAKFLYIVMDRDYNDLNNAEHFRYNVYGKYDTSSQVIETIDYYMDMDYLSSYDLTKYDTYEIVFTVIDGKYLFESVEKK